GPVHRAALRGGPVRRRGAAGRPPAGAAGVAAPPRRASGAPGPRAVADRGGAGPPRLGHDRRPGRRAGPRRRARPPGPPADRLRRGPGGAGQGPPVTEAALDRPAEPLFELPPELAIDTDIARTVIGEFIRGQLRQAGFDRLVLGLSGGIDSALVAYLSAEAI